jgi:hypothetical protein
MWLVLLVTLIAIAYFKNEHLHQCLDAAITWSKSLWLRFHVS